MAMTPVTSGMSVAQHGRVAPGPAPRVGIVGTGFMARVHARAALVSGAVVQGVVGSGTDSGALAADDLGVRRGYADLDAMLPDVDVVHVCTPNDAHLDLTLRSLRAGRHVICEKPLATTVADARAMQEAAEGAGLVGTVPFVYRFHPMVREARARVNAGEVGRIGSLHGSYLQDWLSRGSDQNWRVDPARGGASRAFADIGSHWCDLAEFVTADPIATLSARSATVQPTRGGHRVGTEDVVTVQFVTVAGVLGTLLVSQVAAGRKNRLYLEVSGTDASIGFDQAVAVKSTETVDGWPAGIAPAGSPRTRREPLSSPGSYHPVRAAAAR